MSTPAETRWRNATRPDPRPPGTWWALYPHHCCGCAKRIAVGDLIEYARDRGGNIAEHDGSRYRHARPACRGRWTVRLEFEPWHDEAGGIVPPPAVWTVRRPDGRVVFVTDDARTARLVADARAHGRRDPIEEQDR